jgi:hypothetical protein
MKNLSILALVAAMATPALAGPDHRNFIDQVIKSDAGATASVAGVSASANTGGHDQTDPRNQIGGAVQR